MNIRKAEINDREKIVSILINGRGFLKAQGLTQWQGGQCPSQYVDEDIADNRGYILISQEGTACGYAALTAGVEDAYTNIKDGGWDNAYENYIAIHRVAIDAGFRSKNLAVPFVCGLIEIGEYMGYCDIRIDTHPLNIIMQKVILRAGFVYRGMVEFDIPDGKRKGYQYVVSAGRHNA